ncbi:MAG: pseudouridine synthase [Christensenellaceae bacterium]
MRINKFLAENGVASRRHADAMVAAGRIKINGQTASLGTDVSDEDEVSIDDKPLERAEKKPEYYLMNKPKGILCTAADDRGRKTVVDLLPAGAGRVFPVGRLDYATEGLLILTNDGDLAYRLRIRKMKFLKLTSRGLKGQMTERPQPHSVGDRAGRRYDEKVQGAYHETNKAYTKVRYDYGGKNRQVRRMFEAIGRNVDFLKRVKLVILR